MDDFGFSTPPSGFGEPFRPEVNPAFVLEEPVVFGRAAFRPAVAAMPRKGRERRSPSPSPSPSPNPNSAPAKQYGKQQHSKSSAMLMDQQQREEEAAKARRLQRFGSETEAKTKPQRQVAGNDNAQVLNPNSKGSGTGFNADNLSRVILGGNPRRPDFFQARRFETAAEDYIEPDGADNPSSEAILGICPDMCPGIEREERERKGDLDRFERVEGDRNQTSRELAVKKYTRTAEKDAILIRPLPVLKMAMTHLLSLLERNHEDDLLAVHNFLWDRMRAVRMDLRMQHIFNEDAITMHEQMIRFHIVAMHELCEYTLGEGISEVFNAHLNIEQMNKTSVDLFQMYDDHSKRGLPVPSEPEFRGYYALLKLDKHPGYRVEAAELSLDLARMPSEIRKTPQILFSRLVARACRANNYVAFFRLAREATYLQACLMHAHFSKLRTQALASLHSGLQKNQGIPISTIVDWLGLEGEDITSLIKYHGFSMKMFEEPYMVKDGPFLNKEKDFPTCRAQLVEAKRSVKILLDVQSEGQGKVGVESANKLRNAAITRQSGSIGRWENKSFLSIQPDTRQVGGLPVDQVAVFPVSVEEEMPDYEEEQGQIENEEEQVVMVETPILVVPQEVKVSFEEEEKQGKKRRMEELQFQVEEEERRRLRLEADAIAIAMARKADAAARRAASLAAAAEKRRLEEELRIAIHRAEAEAGKQWRWFRKWKRRAAAKAVERLQKQQRAQAALNTLSFGIPLRKMKILSGNSMTVANRDAYVKEIVEERGKKLQKMWEVVNIPMLVGPFLQERNPFANFLCWKLLLSTTSSAAGKWVVSKLGDTKASRLQSKGVDFSAVGKLIAEEVRLLQGCKGQKKQGFWFTIRDVGCVQTSFLKAASQGTGGVLFVVSESRSVGLECERLRELVHALPAGASLPLLILSTKFWFGTRFSTSEQLNWTDELGSLLELNKLDTGKIAEFCVMSIAENVDFGGNGFYDEDSLRRGLVWLAKKAPLQPQVRLVNAAALVREHLEGHLKVLLGMPLSDVLPEHCIFVFNKALERTAEEIVNTAHAAPPHWPPPEFASVEKQLDQNSESLLLPRQAWSEPDSLEPILAALNACYLPHFPPLGIDSIGSVTTQKVQFENALLQYLILVEGLTIGSPTIASPTIAWEVNRMVQKGCTIEWSQKGRSLIPKWARLFQSIFTARLLLLESSAKAQVYVSRIARSHLPELYSFEKRLPITSLACASEQDISLDQLIGEEYVNPAATKRAITAMFDDDQRRVSGTESGQVTAADTRTLYGDAIEEKEDFIHTLQCTLCSHEVQEGRNRKRYDLPLTESERELDRMIAELQKQERTDIQFGLHESNGWCVAEREGRVIERRGSVSAQEGNSIAYVPKEEQRMKRYELPTTDSELELDRMIAEFRTKDRVQIHHLDVNRSDRWYMLFYQSFSNLERQELYSDPKCRKFWET